MITNVRREVYFLTKLLLIITILLIVVAATLHIQIVPAIAPHFDSTKQTVEESMWNQPDYSKGEHVALQHIANQMRLYPQANFYQAYYRAGDWWDGNDFKMSYNRKEQNISQGNACGCGGGYYPVTEKMIQEVAARHGAMDDFKKMGGVEYP